MSVYNGERYIHEQISSILEMMGKHDKIVISYDVLSDNTLEIINNYIVKGNRNRIIHNKIKGV